MSNPSLGQNIVDAQNFLWKIYRQVEALLKSLDQQLAGRGWTPTQDKRVCWSGDIGPWQNPDKWLLWYLYRYYFSGTSKNQVVGLDIEFEPPTGYSEPVCLVFKAQFDSPRTHDEIFSNWRTSAHVFDFLREKNGVSHIDQPSYRKFLPAASAVVGLVVPLCSLTGEDVLRERIVEPILSAPMPPTPQRPKLHEE